MSKPLEEELAGTLHSIYALKARSPDELEDYFHDAIIKALKQGKPLENWLGYLYKSVSKRVAHGQEGRVYLQLNEALVPDEKSATSSLKLDIKKALAAVSPLRRMYIYEYFYEGYTLEEIAERHGVTNQAVSKSIQKGLAVMKGVLEG